MKNFEKILIFFQARGLRPVANDGDFKTLSCAGVSSRLLKYFFSYFDLKIPIYKAKIEIFFQGVCQKLSMLNSLIFLWYFRVETRYWGGGDRPLAPLELRLWGGHICPTHKIHVDQFKTFYGS